MAVAEHLRFASLLGPSTYFPPKMLVSIEVDLDAVLDLRQPRVVRALGIRRSAFGEEWLRANAFPTQLQVLGTTAREEGVSGILYPSRIEPSAENLVVFPENVGPAGLRVVGTEKT